MSNKFASQLNQYRERAQEALQAYLKPVQGSAARLGEAMAYSLYAGGKRVRPCLCFAVEEALAKRSGHPVSAEGVDQLATAIELVHCYSLIHDDLPCMDDDELRRGRPCCHLVYGEALALLAGDALQGRAFELCLEASRLGRPYLEASIELGQRFGQSGMIAGQVIDLASEGKRLSLEELKEMDLLKTSALIEASVLVPAYLHEVDEEERLLFRRYAQQLGLAFQICDDVLDQTSEAVVLGKSIGKDERDDKSTYVRLLGLEGAQVAAQSATDEALAILLNLEQRGLELGFLKELTMELLNRKH